MSNYIAGDVRVADDGVRGQAPTRWGLADARGSAAGLALRSSLGVSALALRSSIVASVDFTSANGAGRDEWAWQFHVAGIIGRAGRTAMPDGAGRVDREPS